MLFLSETRGSVAWCLFEQFHFFYRFICCFRDWGDTPGNWSLGPPQREKPDINKNTIELFRFSELAFCVLISLTNRTDMGWSGPGIACCGLSGIFSVPWNAYTLYTRFLENEIRKISFKRSNLGLQLRIMI